MSDVPPCKESYEEFLQFSRITLENWDQPDGTIHLPFGAGKEDLVREFLAPALNSSVPQHIHRLFEIARGAMIYSWFFYPLATLGSEQCLRVVESAARERCRELGVKPGTYFLNIANLVSAGAIAEKDEPRWQAARRLRNDRSHLKSLMLCDYGQALDFLRTAAELINTLFPDKRDKGNLFTE